MSYSTIGTIFFISPNPVVISENVKYRNVILKVENDQGYASFPAFRFEKVHIDKPVGFQPGEEVEIFWELNGYCPVDEQGYCKLDKFGDVMNFTNLRAWKIQRPGAAQPAQAAGAAKQPMLPGSVPAAPAANGGTMANTTPTPALNAPQTAQAAPQTAQTAQTVSAPPAIPNSQNQAAPAATPPPSVDPNSGGDDVPF